MRHKENFKDWLIKTLNFDYVKNLISGKENDDLREFVAVLLSFTIMFILIYATVNAKSDSAILQLVIATYTFIATLFGISTYSKNNLLKKEESEKVVEEKEKEEKK